MRTFKLDATNWTSWRDLYRELFSTLGAPEWHGRSIDALIDSMIWGGINDVDPPYAIQILGMSKPPKEVRDEVELLKHAISEACVEFRSREGHDVGIRFETYP